MPKLFWIGSPFFNHSLRACGWEVISHNFEHSAVYGWHDILELAGGPPDAVVVADKSRPPFVLGHETFPCPTVFYAVDTHIHSWLPLYAQGFDLCLVSLRDHLKFFHNQRLPAEHILWSPPFALSSAVPPVTPKPRIWPCLFVGTVKKERTPKRVCFLDALRKFLPHLHITQGAYSVLYPQADVVLNISELGDLNFRVFEALGCGACLVTPGVGHGLDDLFADGRELVTYPELDAQAAGQAILTLLSDPERRGRLAEAGLAAVNAAHRDRHRAETLTRALHSLPDDTVFRRLGEAHHIRSIWLRQIYLLHAAALSGDGLRAAYLQAAGNRQ